MRVQFDHFYEYAELTETLEAWSAAHPQRFAFESIGHSYEGRDIWLCGGATLAGQLMSEIDELVVKINPVLAQQGVRLVTGPFLPRKLVLRGRRAFDSGVTWLSYEVAGPVSSG